MNKNHDEAMEGDSKVIDSLNMSGGRNTLKDSIFGDDSKIESISGRELDKKDFLINDQGIKIEPFFNSSPPNINYDDNQTLTNHQGGSHAFRPQKREIGQFFELEKDYGNVFGNQFGEYIGDKSRYVDSRVKNNELPLNDFPDDYLYNLIFYGGKSVGKSPNMPDWGMTLSKQSLADVIAYLRSNFKGE